MNKFWKALNWIALGFLILICLLGTFYKHISFGAGLGDIFYYFLLYLGTLIHLILTIVARKKSVVWHIVLVVIFLSFAIMIVLYATIWRGSEYRWNGSLFYLPCPHEIKIENDNSEKELLVQMCTMDYYSEFVGTWDGKNIIVKSGEIKIPDELERFIERPIKEVEIVPDTIEYIYESNQAVFKYDTLQVNKEYELSGEITAIHNRTPMMKVHIKSAN